VHGHEPAVEEGPLLLPLASLPVLCHASTGEIPPISCSAPSFCGGQVLLTLGLFIFAPTISNQNFYFLLPWATWYAFAHGQRPAKVFLVAVSVNLFLVYVVLPLNLTNPIWFQWTYDQVGAGHVAPIPSPRFLVRFLDWFASVFKRRELGFAPFIHLMLRMPVWGVMIWWFVSSLRDVFPNRPIAAVRVATP
jgi:hypothetical protein